MNKGFKLELQSENIDILKKNQTYHLKNLALQLDDNKIELSSKLVDTKENIKVNINNHANLTTKKLNGNVSITYRNMDNNISLNSDKITYDGDFNDKFSINIKSKNINIIKPEKLDIKNLTINLKNDILKTNFFIKDTQKKYNINVLNRTDLVKKNLIW